LASGLDLRELLDGAILLAADNFTPRTRTPWAGTRLSQRIKKSLFAKGEILPIGEAWEFSCDPAFPSRLVGSSHLLIDLLTQFPDEILSPAWRGQYSTPHADLLVKLLDAAEPLSLQVHPDDNDPHLAAYECGKPESWLILGAEAGAGIYLGFSRAISRTELQARLQSGENIVSLLNFVSVKPHDYFEIAPGTPHAIGAGVLLLETQRILPGKTGKTYRLWDWNRRYDSEGNPSSSGTARELHMQAALPIIDPLQQVGLPYVRSLQREHLQLPLSLGVKLRLYPANSYAQVFRVEAREGGSCRLEIENGYAAVIALAGATEITSERGKKVTLSQGSPALLPYCAGPYLFNCAEGVDILVIAPASTRILFSN
jgi:mannose-6-phosphate isomerase class I